MNNFCLIVEEKSSPAQNPLSAIEVKHWRVQPNSVVYQRHNGHTLSLYLNGGQTSYRSDKKSVKGAPGKICLMPQSQESRWQINGPIEFIHFYLSDSLVNHFATTQLDMDVRLLELQELLYQDDPALRQLMLNYFDYCQQNHCNSLLHAEQAVNEILYRLVHRYNGFSVRENVIKGGLSATHRKQVKNFIEERIGDELTIDSLAAQVHLSPFHFARMFKASFGESPANYILRLRIDRIKQKLPCDEPLVDLSLANGFSHQSHMTRCFKKLMGTTPANYRKLIRPAVV